MKSFNFMGNFKCSNSSIDIADRSLGNRNTFTSFYEECLKEKMGLPSLQSSTLQEKKGTEIEHKVCAILILCQILQNVDADGY